MVLFLPSLDSGFKTDFAGDDLAVSFCYSGVFLADLIGEGFEVLTSSLNSSFYLSSLLGILRLMIELLLLKLSTSYKFLNLS